MINMLHRFFFFLVLVGWFGCSSTTSNMTDAKVSLSSDPTGGRSNAGTRTLDSISFTAGGTDYDLVILKAIAEDTIEIPRSWEGTRPLLLYRYTSANTRELVVRNDSLVMCQGCGGIFGDPYSGVEFVYDTLKLYHYGGSNWRWAETHEFVRGVNDDWPLVARTSVSYSVFEPDSTSKTTFHMPMATERLATCTTVW